MAHMELQAESKLIEEIEGYKNELNEVTAALECSSTSGNHLDDLKELQLNLITLLELSLNQLKKTDTQNIDKKDGLQIEDDEYKKFQLEIQKLEKDNITGMENTKNLAILPIKKPKSEYLEGDSVRVAYQEKWGGFSYHNAVIFSTTLPANAEYQSSHVSVLFSQPTSLSMLPCRYFLNGKCNFEEKKCKFSHGETVAISELKKYIEPNFDELIIGSKVLTLHEDKDIWHRGKVEQILEGRKAFSIHCLVCNKVVASASNAMVPLFAHDDCYSNHSSVVEMTKNAAVFDIENMQESFVPHDAWTYSSAHGSNLGAWEKHTKGIGSKLMLKMGYVIGNGLGPDGSGRVDPVEARVYPQGLSLDYCKRLRESGMDDSSLRKIVLKREKEEEKKSLVKKSSKQDYSVFDVINKKLLNNSNEKGESSSKLNVSALKKDSGKELNRRNFHLSSDIDKVQSEIISLKRSKRRQSSNAAAFECIDKKLLEKQTQLNHLKKVESKIETEQKNRKDAKKFCIF